MTTTIERETSTAVTFVKTFHEIGIEDIPSVGGKNASLGEMFHELAPAGVKVPDGFAITADAYRQFLLAGGLDREIKRILGGLDTRNVDDLRRRGNEIRHAILAAELPVSLVEAIGDAYTALCGHAPHPIDVAVRSSATAEDLPDAS